MTCTDSTAIAVLATVFIDIEEQTDTPRFQAYLREPWGIGENIEPLFPKAIAEQVVAWMNGITENDDESPICEWSPEGYVLVFVPEMPHEPFAVIQPDDDGLYAFGLGWAWQVEEVFQ